LTARKRLALPIFIACSSQRGRSENMFRFIPSCSLIFRHIDASTAQQHNNRILRVMNASMAAAIKEYG